MSDYFYTPPANIKNDIVVIEGEEFNHLNHVMRKKINEQIMIVDGLGIAYEVSITAIAKRHADAKIVQKFEHHNEPKIKVALAVGILKNPAKFDFLVEKAVELGVSEIIPLKTERTIPQHAKIYRWQKLALAAMKQCGRSFLPKIHDLMIFEDAIRYSKNFNTKIILHQPDLHSESANWQVTVPNVNIDTVIVFIGPEGGFSDLEIEIANDLGIKCLGLGKRRLRTETAAIAACSLLLTGY
ncbi:MAG: RsmE family RNA methyltransferase [Bacteroidota bacterium]|nr:RsmE family RNA methyltransferase [Bacteroidota bacterium]